MNDSSQNQLVAELSRDMVIQVAPQETPLFKANSEAYFKNPEGMLKTQTGKDDMLGFGAAEAIPFLTPIILSVMSEVVKFVTEEVKKSLKAEGSNLISDTVKRMFNQSRSLQKPDEKAVPVLTTAQLAQVRKIAFEKARQLNLPENKAKLLADSVVGRLSLTAA
jgi:hypothetical protein